MEPETLELVLSVVAGVALAAAAGLRAFVPLLAVGLGAHYGLVELSEGFSWLAETPALVALAIAAAVEVGAYYIPGLDHALDLVAAPLALAAGVVVAASVMAELPDWLRWLAALVAGGAATAATYSLSALGRAQAGAVSGGFANPLFSTGELLGSVALVVLALLVPFIALATVLVLVIWALRRRRRRGR